jgi:hypothetical protein
VGGLLGQQPDLFEISYLMSGMIKATLDLELAFIK